MHDAPRHPTALMRVVMYVVGVCLSVVAAAQAPAPAPCPCKRLAQRSKSRSMSTSSPTLRSGWSPTSGLLWGAGRHSSIDPGMG